MMNYERLLNTFLELAQIASPSKGERAIADYIKAHLEAMGIEVEEDSSAEEIGGSTGNLIVRYPHGTAGSPLLFVAHMDTVEPCQGVKPVIQNGYVYSDGSTILGSDDKAGVAVLMEILATLKEQNLKVPPVEIAFTVAEEIGLLGSKHLKAASFKAPFAIVLDSAAPPGGIVVKAPSAQSIRVLCHGVAAHSGIDPEKGISAIKMASLAITSMALGRIDPDTTANIGLIKGGQATNIVPELVEVKGEARSFKEEKLLAQVAHMRQCFEKAAREMKGKVDFEAHYDYRAFDIEPSRPGVQRIKEAAKREGLEFTLQSSGGGSDANILNASGIESVVLGMGMKKVHTTQEYIAIDDLIKSAKFILSIIRGA